MPQTVELNTGQVVPAVCFGGGMRLKDPAVFERALRAGFRFFDTAFTYRNDHLIFDSETGRRLIAGERDRIVVCSKTNLSLPLPDALEQALERMGLDRLDLLLLHHPVQPAGADHLEVLMRRWQEMEALVDEGRVAGLGVSNTGAALLKYLLDSARIRPAVDQVEFHPYMWDPALFEVATAAGVRIQAYCPLGSPWRAAETGRQAPTDDEAIAAIARSTGKSASQVILRWHIQKGVIPVVSARSEGHLRENLDIFDFELGEQDVAAIDALERGDRIWRDDPKLAGLYGAVSRGVLTIPKGWPR